MVHVPMSFLLLFVVGISTDLLDYKPDYMNVTNVRGTTQLIKKVFPANAVG